MIDRTLAVAEHKTITEIRQDPASWSMAALGWIQSKRSPNTRNTYSRAMQRFFDFINKPPWQIVGSDAIRWQTELRRRGLKESSINFYLSALSSYYEYCLRRYTVIDPATDREESLATMNPATRPQRTKITPYGRATYLNKKQTQELLLAIDRLTPNGARDYALIVGFVLTGARDSELRCLQWGDLAVKNDHIVWSWRGKGGQTERRQFPWPAYHAIKDYLRLSERLESIKNDDYVFIPHHDIATNFASVETIKEPGEAPISNTRLNQIVKMYARWAGINGRISVHSLRHTAAMLRLEHTTDLQDIQRFLHHASLNTTQIYIDHLRTHTDPIALKVAARLGITE